MIEAGPPNVILLRKNKPDTSASGTFDYSDLNAYLLVVVGLASPEQNERVDYDSLANKAREGVAIPLAEIQDLAQKGPLTILSEHDDLSKAIEHFGSGIHRILICKDGTTEVIGILSQLKLVRFLWEHGTSFPTIDGLYPMSLKDLGIGTPQAISIK